MRFAALIFSIFLILGCTSLDSGKQARGDALQFEKAQLVFHPANVSISVEKAQTAAQRERGLMYRTELGEREGMLFLFPEQEQPSLWMANTLIPLEAIFLDGNMTVVDIVGMDPCTVFITAFCPNYYPKKPARYALEVNWGFARKYGIKEGSTAEIIAP